MASEYLKWKYRDVQHRETPEYTPEEKRKNWWYYNKWLVIGGIIGVLLLADLGATALGLKEKHPDCRIAFITETKYSDEAIAAFQDALEEYAEDYSKDKEVYIEVRQYVMPDNPTVEEQMYMAYASEITLVSDLESCDSFLIITKDPDVFQKSFEVLCYPDGTLPTDFSEGTSCAKAISSLSSFTNMDIAADLREYLNDCYIARRGFWTEKTCDNLEGSVSFYEALLSGKKGN